MVICSVVEVYVYCVVIQLLAESWVRLEISGFGVLNGDANGFWMMQTRIVVAEVEMVDILIWAGFARPNA